MHDGIEIKEGPYGRGVFATRAFAKGESVESCPTLELPEDVARVFETNVYGIVRVTRAFQPALERSGHPVIVNVSSGMGSIAVTSDPERVESTIVSLPYPTSKTAVNMLTTQYAKAYPRIRINAVDPGYTATEFNGHRGHQTVTEGTDAIVAMAGLGPDGPTGTFVDRRGPVPW